MKGRSFLMVLALACEPAPGAGGHGDCREADHACASGFECSPTSDTWTCVRVVGDSGGRDSGPQPGVDGGSGEPDGEVQDEAAGACSGDEDCPDGVPCNDGLPGGLCELACEAQDDCAGDTVCAQDYVGSEVCTSSCAEQGCRAGWTCDERHEPPVCRPACPETGCPAELECDPGSGLCVDAEMCGEEVCNEKDDDCDGEVDEGTLNACGQCGAVPPEICNGTDDDCDGGTDEEVLNACGACGPTPQEVCDGADQDCDGAVDEGVRNMCGDCGPAPQEVCNTEDDDCDGEIDEGVLNACGICGAAPVEVCDGADQDCDGAVDEGVANACGECGDLPDDLCNGEDEDCDGEVDEDPGCEDRQGCVEGECVELAGFGQPCEGDEYCESALCFPPEDGWPNGFCGQRCVDEGDCGNLGLCLLGPEESYCFETCRGGQGDCRLGYVCLPDPNQANGDGACISHCRNIGCREGARCAEDGFCRVRTYRVRFEQALISPGVVGDGTYWDGPGRVPQEVWNQLSVALLGANPFAAVAGLLAGPLVAAVQAPDPFGEAHLVEPGWDDWVRVLPVRDNNHSPIWGVEWDGVVLRPDSDIRVRIRLYDEDLQFDDEIGVVEVSAADLRAALRAGEVHPVRVDDQSLGQILFVTVSVIEE